ncbi:MAG: branched-chain amino acid ABC transporter ATP-binding protein, partial [Burkholderiales bacterium RIFCSPLOWO2_12_FULL_64_99]
MRSMLEIRGLRGGYGQVEVLRGISMSIGAGEIVAVLGSNGAGKSTLNNTLCGIVPAFSGQVRFDGHDVTRSRYTDIVAAGLIQVPEGRRIFPNLTVLENLALGSYLRGRAKREQNIERVFAIFPRLGERVAQRAGTLSGGEQQMLAIGRGLMGEPRLLILDEPSLGLSPLLVEEVFDLIRRLNDEGLTILLVEQNVGQSL